MISRRSWVVPDESDVSRSLQRQRDAPVRARVECENPMRTVSCKVPCRYDITGPINSGRSLAPRPSLASRRNVRSTVSTTNPPVRPAGAQSRAAQGWSLATSFSGPAEYCGCVVDPVSVFERLSAARKTHRRNPRGGRLLHEQTPCLSNRLPGRVGRRLEQFSGIFDCH